MDPNNPADIQFHKTRISGSSLLAYGFLKPVLINQKFASLYSFNSSNSFIYDNSNFSKVMKKAISLNFKDYRKLQHNLSILSKEIYAKSLYNMKTCLKELIK